MPRGGAKAGAGRPARECAKRVMLELDADEAKRLERLQVELRKTAADVLRSGLLALESR